MSTQEEQQMTENKSRIMTGFIHYGETDNMEKIFDILKEFRTKYGLKYSHQSKAQMVFFNLSFEHLEELSKVRPFKISRFQTKTEYKCDEATSNQLMGQKDSFLRMVWNDESSTLTFLSRTPSRVHGNLVRRIFRDSGVQFQKDSYVVFNNASSKLDDESNDASDVETNKVEQSSHQDHDDTPDGFQRVERKTRKPKKTNSTASKVVKVSESRPKVRGSKVTMASKA